MRLTRFQAIAQPTGRRIDLSWDLYPEAGEAATDPPPVRILRKTRDFEFPALADGADPFLIFDSQTFVPDATRPPYYLLEDELRVTEIVDLANLSLNGSEPLPRRWIRVYRQANDSVDHYSVRIADYGNPDAGGLDPGTTYYYQIEDAGDAEPPLFAGQTLARSRAVAQATENYGMASRLYELLPAVHLRYDGRGELRRFTSIFGEQLNALRSSAEYLPELHDVDSVDYRMLPHLAEWLGWDLNFAASIPLQRHEIKYAPALYRITGTIPGCQIWVKRLTGWDCQVKEFYRNVFFTNDFGNPDDLDDHGSRTVDTANAALMTAIRTFNDDLDYTYDTGVQDDDWYAYKVIGIFVRPNDGETANSVSRKLTNLRTNLSIFLPVNLRGVVILDIDTETSTETKTLDLLSAAVDAIDTD